MPPPRRSSTNPPPAPPSARSSQQNEHPADTMNSKPRQAPPGGVSAVAHTLTANDAATLTLSVAEQLSATGRVRAVDAGPRMVAAQTLVSRGVSSLTARF